MCVTLKYYQTHIYHHSCPVSGLAICIYILNICVILLFSGSRDKVLIVWDLESYEKTKTIPVYEVHIPYKTTYFAIYHHFSNK